MRKPKEYEVQEPGDLVQVDILGGFFISHPPMRKFRVDVADGSDALTKDLPESFEVTDEMCEKY
ncbi:MAG: hypothetical protein ACE5KI_00595 [Dehalococcoidia bacterium]